MKKAIFLSSSRLIFGHHRPPFLAALSPPDRLAAFRWLSPDNQLPVERLIPYPYLLVQVQELNGDRADTLASHRQLRSQLSSLVDASHAAIKRLSK